MEDHEALTPMNIHFRDIPISSYIKLVAIGSLPKMFIILFCVIIAAYTTEITAYSDLAATQVCFGNPKAETSGHRVCFSLMGVAISSIMVCMILMIFDVFIPCVDMKFRRLGHIFSLVLSLIMGIALLVTSSWMVNLYVKYCDYLKDYHYDYYDDTTKCGHNESRFLILPIFGFITMVAWGFNGLICITRMHGK